MMGWVLRTVRCCGPPSGCCAMPAGISCIVTGCCPVEDGACAHKKDRTMVRTMNFISKISAVFAFNHDDRAEFSEKFEISPLTK